MPENPKTVVAPLGKQARFALALLVILALGALFWPRSKEDSTAPGGFLVDASGRPVTLATRMAPVTLVHFWATWCAPCMTEVPALKRLVADFKDEPDFNVVMIAVDDEVRDVEPFLGSLSPMALFDPTWDVAHRYGTFKLPETYLVVHGEVVTAPTQTIEPGKWLGATNWDDPKIRGDLRSVLEQERSGSTAKL